MVDPVLGPLNCATRTGPGFVDVLTDDFFFEAAGTQDVVSDLKVDD